MMPAAFGYFVVFFNPFVGREAETRHGITTACSSRCTRNGPAAACGTRRRSSSQCWGAKAEWWLPPSEHSSTCLSSHSRFASSSRESTLE